MPKKDIIVVQGDWNAKIGEDASKNRKGICDQYCNPETNERGLRLLDFASPHKPSRRWAWHSPGGEYHNQIDHIMVKLRFQSSVNIPKTRRFPGADIGSDHEHEMMTFRLRLQRMKKQANIRTKFSLEKLDGPTVAENFRATIGGKFAPLLVLNNQDTKIDTLVGSFDTAVTKTANDIIGKHRSTKKPWVTDDILKLSDKWRKIKQRKNTDEGAKIYREANQQVKKAKEMWIEEQCQGIEENLQKNDSKKAY